MAWDAPAALMPRRWRFEITERVDAQRQVASPELKVEA